MENVPPFQGLPVLGAVTQGGARGLALPWAEEWLRLWCEGRGADSKRPMDQRRPSKPFSGFAVKKASDPGLTPLALDRERRFPPGQPDQVHFVALFVAPVAQVPDGEMRRQFVERIMLPEPAQVVGPRVGPAAVEAHEAGVETIDLRRGDDLVFVWYGQTQSGFRLVIRGRGAGGDPVAGATRLGVTAITPSPQSKPGGPPPVPGR